MSSARYSELLKQALSFQEAFARVVAEKGPGVNALLPKDTYPQLQQAQHLAADNKHDEANALLAKVCDHMALALSRARAHETVVHNLVFDSPVEEYAYERERNRSHEMLIDMVLAERNPSPGNRQIIQKFPEFLRGEPLAARRGRAASFGRHLRVGDQVPGAGDAQPGARAPCRRTDASRITFYEAI